MLTQVWAVSNEYLTMSSDFVVMWKNAKLTFFMSVSLAMSGYVIYRLVLGFTYL